jgi:glucose-6-phosphate isomerase
MPYHSTAESPVEKKLKDCADIIRQPENHLKCLLKQDNRFEKFSLKGAGIFYDFSRQRVDDNTMSLLFEIAEIKQLKQRFRDMVRGKKVNTTENRAALHTATRDFSNRSVFLDGIDVMPAIRKVREEIKDFTEKVYEGKITGSTGKPFRHVVVIGIGGSYLGTEFVSHALDAFSKDRIALHFLSNVDIHDFGRVIKLIDPETTLWIVISKSYTTTETLANENQARAFMKEKGLDPVGHFVAVTSRGSPGDRHGAEMLCSFHMYDYIGGRYSVTSAVGGVPLSLKLGYRQFENFLKGAEEMDRHAEQTLPEKNLPLTAALIGFWNAHFLGYPAQAIIPYSHPLRKLPAHIQQLYMESNGKSATREGELLTDPAGAIIFGEPGTNAQHSFFQLAHQGRPFPIDFIGVVQPQYPQYQATSKGVTNYQELWANLISQPSALAIGKESEDPSRSFPGNRPSSTILLNDLSPESVGRLLAFYEARTIFEAFIWGINPFDQFGVELGKTLASNVREAMKKKSENIDHQFADMDPIIRFYLHTLFTGHL